MQELTFNLPFDATIFLHHQKLKWQVFVKKKYSRYIYFYGTITIILLIVLVNLLLGNGKPYSDAFFAVTLFLLIYNILTPWASIYKSRKRFFDAANKIAFDPEREKFKSKYSFNDEGVTYEDSERFYKMKWSLFKPFYVYKDTLFLTSEEHETIFFMLGRTDVEESLFNNIHEFLKEHVGLKKINF